MNDKVKKGPRHQTRSFFTMQILIPNLFPNHIQEQQLHNADGGHDHGYSGLTF